LNWSQVELFVFELFENPCQKEEKRFFFKLQANFIDSRMKLQANFIDSRRLLHRLQEDGK